MPLSLPPGLMVSVSGFRGRVGDPLTPELVASVAAGLGAFLQAEGAGNRVFLGRDSRTSGPMLVRAAASGLMSVGCHVVDLGLVSTPTLMLAIREDGAAAGGIGITASHNPAEWNAMKLAGGDGTFLDAERSAAFQRFLRDEEIPRAPWDGLGSIREDEGAADRHRQRILALPVLDVEALRRRRFRVALDCVNGAGGTILPVLLESLGCEVTAIGTEPDGHFPRDPEPTAANLADLGRLVLQSGADVGFAVDPDVDRLSLVDGEGIPLGEDMTLALAAAVVLRRTPGTVVTNLSTSRVVEDVAEASGARTVRSAVGEINVARRMQEEGAVVGGEGNGGVILPALHLTRDALLGAALILQHLLDTGGSLRAAASSWPEYHIVKEKVSFPRESLPEAYEALVAGFGGAEVDRTDGLRFSWAATREWVHVRPSGTEPVVRIIAEAPAEARALALVEVARRHLHEMT
jgi:phosphomannomutase